MWKKKKHTEHEEEGGEAWLLPYSDLMTLLLAVFIVLFAVSQVDAQKAQGMSDEFSESMMTQSYTQHRQEEKMQKEALTEEEIDLQEMEALKTELDCRLQNENMSAYVITSIGKRGLMIRLSNAIFFDPGSADIKGEYEKVLEVIAEIITFKDNRIRIEGHTDNVPMSSDIYPSNWELSTARAISVVRLFIDKTHASPEKFLAVGYGEYRPVADNTTEEGRAKNRRIDIIVLSEEYNDLEKQFAE